MQAIILAAGMGRRLKELTDDATKCMVKVNGVTMIERMLSQLDGLGLTRIILVVGYKADRLRGFVEGLGVKTPIEYVENPVYDKTNNIYSLYLARECLREQDTLLLESDLIFDDCVLRSLVDDPHPSLALVAKYERWMDGAVVTLGEGCYIDSFLDKSQFRFEDAGSYYKTVNIYKFSRLFSDKYYVPFLEAYSHALGNNEYYEQVLKIITKLDNSELKAKVLEKGAWYEIDDAQDLDIAESIFDPVDANRFDRVNSRYGGFWRYPNMLDFCYLVNPYFPPQRLMDEIKASFEALAMQYPSGQRVNNLLAGKFFGVAPSKVVTGNGAAEIIKSIVGYLERGVGGGIGIVRPTFEEYPNRKNGGIVAFRPGGDSFSYSADDLMGFFGDKDISALVVINPDNPSGNYLSREEASRLVEWTKGKGIRLVWDESFVDFADMGDTLLDDGILSENPHLVVVKSISKAYGVPGFRLGVMACGDEGLAEAVRKDLSIWNINSFGEFYLQVCEKYKSDFVEGMQRFYPVRDAFFEALAGIPYLEPIPSKANYITCRLLGGASARGLAIFLLAKHDILIKDLSGKNGIEGEYIRVAVKLPEENARLAEALRGYGALEGAF